MDHSETPVLDALAAYHREDQLPFTPPGHKQSRGADPRPVRDWATTSTRKEGQP